MPKALVCCFLAASAAASASAGFTFSPLGVAPQSQPASLQPGPATLSQQLKEVLPASRDQPATNFEPALDQPKESQEAGEAKDELLASATAFNSASSEDTQEQKAVEEAIGDALASESTQLGEANRGLDYLANKPCIPDFMQCPLGWVSKGVFCSATESYNGECEAEADLSTMNAEQKLAWASHCDVEFPCQEGCLGGQDFDENCPSLWREVAPGVCSAPTGYEGGCSVRLDASLLTAEEKYVWSKKCAASWPCKPHALHNYLEICPSGWSLQAGQICTASEDYKGPCEHTAYLSGATESDKKAFEASCAVTWPSMGRACKQNFAADCPFGWLQSSSGMCFAPAGYNTCGTQRSFADMGPAEREDWAQMCAVKFPCRDRSSCEKAMDAVCPAGWYSSNAGQTCNAPLSYKGVCNPVLHGLSDLSHEEKHAIGTKCGFEWPCHGELYDGLLHQGTKVAGPRESKDAAAYTAANGAIDAQTGAIR